MSRSSLWVMDKDYKGCEVLEFSNSWLFSPIVWDALLDKYLHREIQTPYGYTKSLLMDNDGSLDYKLNEKVNNCDCMADRICWEMSNQQVFFTKDKQVIAQGIRDFVTLNARFDRHSDGLYPLEQSHIIGRFNSIANEILKLDEKESPYFIFKNTSVDDNVEYWFYKYDEEADECNNRSLREWDKHVTEFVFIEDGKIIGFKSNVMYFSEGRDTSCASH